LLEQYENIYSNLQHTIIKLHYLGNEVEIGNKGRLKNNGHVGGVEQFDWI
jgi:hypothetical protein